MGGDDVVDASATGLPLSASGGAGDDTLIAGENVTLNDAAGGASDLSGGGGNDRLVGSSRGDFLNGDLGTSGNDTLIGNGGDDVMFGGAGSDLVDGGDGSDTHDYTGQTGPATITLADGLCNDGTQSDVAPVGSAAAQGCSANGVDRDLIRAVELASGTDASDDIIGGAVAERLNGLSGDDNLEGGPGADTLLGAQGADVLFARDGFVDDATQCGQVSSDRTPGDRALADEEDPVDPSCTTIERGSPGTAGPVGTPPSSAPEAPPTFQPTPTSEITPNVPPNGSEGAGPGGGDGGQTPPELEITSPAATVIKGRAELRVRCVYLAKDCVGEITLSARKAAKAGKGKKRVKIKKGAALGSQEVRIPWGTSEPTRVAVSRRLRKLFKAGAERIAATAQVRARDGAAGAGAAKAKVRAPVVLGAPRR